MLPRSGECRSVAEEEERRLVMTGSVCLDKFIVDTDRLSASRSKQTGQRQINVCIEQQNVRQIRGDERESWSQQSLWKVSSVVKSC